MAFWRNHSEKINALRAFFGIKPADKVEGEVRPRGVMKVTYAGAGNWTDSMSRPRHRYFLRRQAAADLADKFGWRSARTFTVEWGSNFAPRRFRREVARELARGMYRKARVEERMIRDTQSMLHNRTRGTTICNMEGGELPQ